MSSRRTSVLVVLLLCALAAVWWFGLVKPAKDDADGLAATRSALESNVADLESQVKQARSEEVLASYPAELQLVAETDAIDMLKSQLEGIVAESEMTVNSVTATGETEDFTEASHLVEVRIVLAGSAIDVGTVAGQLETNIPALVISSVRAEDSAAAGQGVSTITGMLLVSN